MAKKFPLSPAHPERTCWGCDRYCAATEMICGNGTERTQHPSELYGEGWQGWGLDPVQAVTVPPTPPARPKLVVRLKRCASAADQAA